MRLGRDFRHLEQLAQSLGLSMATLQRYAKGSSPITWLSRLFNSITGGGARASDRMRQSEIPAAVLQALEQMAGAGGGAVEAPEERRTGGGRGRGGNPSLPAPPGRGGRTPPPPVQPGGGSSNLPPGGFNRSPFNPNYAPPLPGESNPYSEEILCGDISSNVFSFSYDAQASTLYVTYKAHGVNSGSVRRGRVRRGKGRGRPQLIGKLGSTVSGGRSNDRGSMYAYFDVPARVFARMKGASSKGKFVWDELRVRGTVYGHKYRYSLVHGQVTPGASGVYIPRKATAQGFRSRSLADLGNGRRGFQTSTLPSQGGFSTRRRR